MSRSKVVEGVPASGAGRGPASRDGFLDVVRTVAVLRVVVWHAFGAAVITYVLSAVPAMFFVAGSLLAKSLDRRGWRAVLRDRYRRLLVPLWALSAVAFAAMATASAIGGTPNTRVPWRSVVFWIVPLGDPGGSAWEGGWISSPLWYLRAMVWLLLLAPLLLRAVRRHPLIAIAVPLGVVLALDWVGRRWTIHQAPLLLWQVGDVALYAIFLMAGFLHRDGRFDRVCSSQWLKIAAGFAVAAVAWIATQPVPLHVVNNSHPAHLLVGASWLAVLLAVQTPLGTLAHRRVTGPFVRWMTQRTMTVYLWHSTAIIVTFEALRTVHFPSGIYPIALLSGTMCVTAAFVAVFGWIEDWASRRPMQLWPVVRSATIRAGEQPSPSRRSGRSLHTPALSAAVVAAVLLGISAVAEASTSPQVTATASAVTSTGNDNVESPGSATATADTSAPNSSGRRRPPVPSKAPPRADFQRTANPDPAPTTVAPSFSTTTTGAPNTAAANGTTTALAQLSALPTQSGSAGTAEALPVHLDANQSNDLQRTLDAWRSTWSVPDVQAGVLASDGRRWKGNSGIDPDTAAATQPDDRFDIDSITKTFTAALVLQLADEGQLRLDDPLPTLQQVPDFPYATQLTVRELLTHRSGLAPYRETTRWAQNPDSIDTPAHAVAAAGADPLRWEPNTASGYSSTNYLVLGLLIEQITGHTFDDLVADRFLGPLHLEDTTHLPPAPQTPNGAAGGIVSTIDDLLSWGAALYRDQIVVTPDDYTTMTTFDPGTSLGAGTFAYCPCNLLPDGTPQWRYIGHSGGRTILQYAPADHLIIVINVSDSLWLPDRSRAITDLTEQLRAVTLAQTEPTAAGEATPSDQATPAPAPTTLPETPAPPETTAPPETSDADPTLDTPATDPATDQPRNPLAPVNGTGPAAADPPPETTATLDEEPSAAPLRQPVTEREES